MKMTHTLDANKVWSFMRNTYVNESFVNYSIAVLCYVGTVVISFTLVAKMVYGVSFENIPTKQKVRELKLNAEALVTYIILFHGYAEYFGLKWERIGMAEFVKEFAIYSIVFNLWFYVNHRLWHAVPFLYKHVHKHHHDSYIVWPLSSLSNNWLESLFTSIGFIIIPCFFPEYCHFNSYSWLASIFSVVFVAAAGHSRIPYTLEHATHHLIRTKNYGFINSAMCLPNIDWAMGTYKEAIDEKRVHKHYKAEVEAYYPAFIEKQK